MFTRAVLCLLLLASGRIFAHAAPHSMVIFDFHAATVDGQVLIPESELSFATAAEQGQPPFTAYLLRHFAVETPDGARWQVQLRSVGKTSFEGHDYLLAHVELTPPAGASTASFVLIDDAVTHEVRNHVVTVHVRGDRQAEFRGALQYPARRLQVQRP